MQLAVRPARIVAGRVLLSPVVIGCKPGMISASRGRQVAARERFDLGRYGTVYAYGDSAEDRGMLELARRKYYRWQEISSWNDVTEYAHPPSR
jgi:hypothetical protein